MKIDKKCHDKSMTIYITISKKLNEIRDLPKNVMLCRERALCKLSNKPELAVPKNQNSKFRKLQTVENIDKNHPKTGT